MVSIESQVFLRIIKKKFNQFSRSSRIIHEVLPRFVSPPPPPYPQCTYVALLNLNKIISIQSRKPTAVESYIFICLTCACIHSYCNPFCNQGRVVFYCKRAANRDCEVDINRSMSSFKKQISICETSKETQALI